MTINLTAEMVERLAKHNYECEYGILTPLDGPQWEDLVDDLTETDRVESYRGEARAQLEIALFGEPA